MGNFVPWLMTQNLHLNREVYQPVHNIYLLIYAEVGIAGIALFILFWLFFCMISIIGSVSKSCTIFIWADYYFGTCFWSF